MRITQHEENRGAGTEGRRGGEGERGRGEEGERSKGERRCGKERDKGDGKKKSEIVDTVRSSFPIPFKLTPGLFLEFVNSGV